MRIYTKAVSYWDDALGRYVTDEAASEWYDYEGPIAEAKKGGKAPKAPDPNVVSAAQTQSNQDTAAFNAALNRVSTYTPAGSSVFTQTGTDTSGAPIYRQDVTLSPDAQAQYEQEMAQNRQLGNIAGGMMNRIEQNFGQPMDTANLPALTGQVDTNGLPQLFGAEDLMGARQQVQDALYNRQAAYLDPQWASRDNAFRTRMANQGVVEGSEAWRNAIDDESRARTFDYERAREAAITGGGNEMSLLSGIASGNRGQLFGERQTNAGLSNAARAQGMNELYAARALPLNEFNALRSAGQVDMPQFEGAQPVNMANTDVSGNMWNAYNANMQRYNAQQQQGNNIMSGLFGLGAAALSNPAMLALSDERLKENVEKVGRLPGGPNVYEYEFKADPTNTREIGVMAQEVERTQPDAVMRDPKTGYRKVNYAKVLARAMKESPVFADVQRDARVGGYVLHGGRYGRS